MSDHPEHPNGPDPWCVECNAELGGAPAEAAEPAKFLTHRYTTNNRGPGQQGTAAAISIATLITCPKCQRKRLDLGGPHSPHFSPAHGSLVDCVGDRIPFRSAA